MPNLMDYLEWRGDLTFSEAPLNEVDNLAFCLLSYVDLDGVVPADPRMGKITLRAAAAEYFFSHPESGDRPLGLIIPADILILFRRMAHTRRFRDLELTGFVDADAVAPFAVDAFTWAVSTGLVEGSETAEGMCLKPADLLNRAQAAILLQRCVESFT